MCLPTRWKAWIIQPKTMDACSKTKKMEKPRRARQNGEAPFIFQETTSNDGLDLTKFSDYAKRVGLNVAKFNECLNSSKYASAVQEDEQDAQAAGARGTPYSVLVGPKGEKIPLSGALPYAQVKAAIDSALGAS